MKLCKQKGGFTLVELLAVIVILAIILAIAIPGITGIVNSATRGAFSSDAKLVLQQFEYEKLRDSNFDETIVDEKMITSFNISNENYDDLAVGIINFKPYIVIVGKNKWDGLKACGTMQDMKVVSVSDTTTCQKLPLPLYNASKGVNRPVLVDGMTPVVWNGSNWTEVDEDDDNWYDYIGGTKKWANAQTEDGSLWVWIPRYAYQIATGYHTNSVGAVNVKFLITKTNTTSDSTVIMTSPAYTGNSQDNYVVHPAFNYDGKVMTGMWVAKYEASGAINAIAIEPNVSSIFTGLAVTDMFAAARNMEMNNRYGWGTNGTGIDTHMMKNTEWGAVAYLAQSTYGKNAALSINNSSTHITGCAGDIPVAPSYSGCQFGFTTIEGQGASTTGNIYGIFDMAGGTAEYVMANLNNLSASSGFYDVSSIENRYINRYTGYNTNIFGDATFEISNNDGGSSWYGDKAVMINATSPWMIRGGAASDLDAAGTFAFDRDAGNNTNVTFRPTLMIGEGL